jgi:hypothetical protein
MVVVQRDCGLQVRQTFRRQRLAGHGRQSSRHMLAERAAVEPQAGSGQNADGFGGDVEQRFAEGMLEAVERAAQACAAFTLVALRPEQGRKRIAALKLLVHGQVDQQRLRLAQVQLDRLAIVVQARRAEHIQFYVRHRVLSNPLRRSISRDHYTTVEQLSASSERTVTSSFPSPREDLLDHRGLGVGVVLHILPVLARKFALGALVELALGGVRAQPIAE